MDSIVSKAMVIKKDERYRGVRPSLDQMKTVLAAEKLLRGHLQTVPSPLLRIEAVEVPLPHPRGLHLVREQIELMTALMAVFDGQGLGAQQAGYTSRVITLAVDGWPRLQHMVNPRITSMGDKKKGFMESCLSIPLREDQQDVRPLREVYVWRPITIDVEWLDVMMCACGHSHDNHDEAGRCQILCFGDPDIGDHECPCLQFEPKICKMRAKDMLARVIQHEVDHLNGKLITDYESVR